MADPRITLNVTPAYEEIEVAGMTVPVDAATARMIREAIRDEDWEHVGQLLAGAKADGSIPDHETRRRKARLAATITQAQKELAKLNAMPPEPTTGVNPVVVFDKTFGQNKTYAFVAIKANGLWHTTGDRGNNRRVTWPDLWRFIIEAEPEAPQVSVVEQVRVI